MVHLDFIAVHRSADASLSQQFCTLRIFVCEYLCKAKDQTSVLRCRRMHNDGSLNAPLDKYLPL